jgi:uncharacterized protein (TIGR04255 family)
MKLPKKISPEPIIESVCELRFDLNIIPDVVFGIFYNSLKSKYPNIEKLPILQIPDAIRLNDPKFKNKPHYKIFNDVFNVQIGPSVCSVSKRNDYPGWEVFLEEIMYVFNEIKNLKIINKVNRFGLRYIDFFEKVNIFEKINLNLTINNEPKIKNNQSITVLEEINDFNLLLQISNNAIQVKGSDKIKGSIFDVDIVLRNIDDSFFSNLNNILENAHLKSKEYYFSMLKSDFLKSLNPEY